MRELLPALRQAASIARALEGRVANRPKDGEASDVKAALTVADTASQEALLVPLHARFPHVRVQAEEDTPTVRRFPAEGRDLVVIDPIDGTLRFYLEGAGPYAVLLGLARDGIYEASLAALPREDLFFAAVRGGGARRARGEGAARAVHAEATGRRVLVSHDLPEPAARLLAEQGYEVAPASGGAIALGPLVPGVCAGLRLVREPGPGVSIRGRIAALVAAEAGAQVAGADGAPFPRDIEAPAPALLVARDDRTLADLVAATERGRS